MDAGDAIVKACSSDYNLRRVFCLLNCGFTAGLLQAAVFNPWDRALYLSVLTHRKFLHRENFREPMRGVLQTIVQKAISGGLYFPLEEIFSSYIREYLDTNYKSKYTSIFLGGMLAGAVNGILLNPFSRIKVSHHMDY